MGWAPDYATVADLKHYLRVTDTVDDTDMAIDITAASRAIDRAAGGRQFGVLSAAVEWEYTAVYNRHRDCWVVYTEDFATTTGLAVVVDGVTVTDYRVGPSRAVAKGKVWTFITLGPTVACSGDPQGVKVTALWGWPAVPSGVKLACLLQASRFLARRDSPYGVAGSPSEGSEMRLLATVDPDVRVSLGSYVRIAGAE
jgi:hypothetical protein